MLLAIDTSTRYVGLALFDGVQILGEVVWFSRNHQTVELAPLVEQTLMRTGKTARDLQAIAVALGPGSFTGLRVGIALAKGISLATHIPLVGIPTLDILAVAQPLLPQPLVAVARAGRGRLAVGRYQVIENEWRSTEEVEILTPHDLSQQLTEPTLVCGELTAEERRLLGRKRVNVILASPVQCLRRPSFLAELGWRRIKLGKIDDPATLTPIYVQ